MSCRWPLAASPSRLRRSVSTLLTRWETYVRNKFAMATWHHSDASALLRTRKPKSWTRRLLRAWSGCVLPLTTLSTLLACQERPEPLTQQHDAQLGVRGALHVQHADVWPSRPCCCRHPAQAWRTQPPNRRRRTPPLSRSIVMKP